MSRTIYFNDNWYFTKNDFLNVTEIKVYSNQSRITLYVDGKRAAEEEGKTVFRFTVPLSGEHRIEAGVHKIREE